MQRPAAIWKRLQLRHDMLRKQAREHNPAADASDRDHGKQHGGRLARGKLSPVQLASVGVEGLGQAAALLVLAVLALLALYLKLEQLKEVTQLGPHQWSARNWLQVRAVPRRTACLSICDTRDTHLVVCGRARLAVAPQFIGFANQMMGIVRES
eukprot:COSAG01_NODE_4778_length_4749_cov_231.390108_3_plen_154_part_00